MEHSGFKEEKLHTQTQSFTLLELSYLVDIPFGQLKQLDCPLKF